MNKLWIQVIKSLGAGTVWLKYYYAYLLIIVFGTLVLSYFKGNKVVCYCFGLLFQLFSFYLTILNNFISSNSDGSSFDIHKNIDETYNYILYNFISFLKPVHVDYPIDLLSDQIQFIAIALFMLCIASIILLISLLFNIIIFTYSDKLYNYFNNKYIKLYIYYNKKFIVLEILLTSILLIFNLINITYGIHFIATHPVIFN